MKQVLSTKEKLKQLVMRYAVAIKNDNIDEKKFSEKYPDREGGVKGIPAAEITKTALALASDAFKAPGYTYYFKVAPEDIHTHSYHFEETLDLASLTSLVEAAEKSEGSVDDVAELNTYFSQCFARVDGLCNLLVSFTNPIPNTFEVREDLDEIGELFLRIGKINGCKYGDALLNALNPSEVSSAEVKIGNSLSVTSGILFTRLMSFLLVSTPALNFSQTIEVAEYCSLQCQGDPKQRKDLVQAMCRISSSTLERLVSHFQETLSLQLLGASSDKLRDSDLTGLAEILSLLNDVNYLPSHPRGLIPFAKMYNSTCADFSMDDMKEDFYRRMENKDAEAKAGPDGDFKKRFCFSDYPFLVDANFKSTILQFDSIIEHRQAMRHAMLGARLGMGQDQPFMILNIARDNLMESTLNELNRKRGDLRKPLHVKFQGEEGIDEGGPRKEFFQLICKQLFDPNYGMFTTEKGNFYWINPTLTCSHCNIQFYLIGQVLGLAVYNNVILDVQFPKVLFRKLLGQTVDFEDLKELDPGYAQGLQELLDFEESEDLSIKDVFMRNFTYEHEVFGETVECDIIPNGKNVELTGDNRHDFVNAITEYVLNGCIAGNFKEFKNGFMSVCDRDLVKSMRPEELELLVCGNPELDFKELEKSTKYDGYEKSDETIKMFWQVVHEFTPEQQRTFLKFCTGSDRVPIRGLKDLGFIIGKNGEEDSGLLPTSHTCFNHLLLPEYKNKDVLKAKLLLAIENCTGFGLK